MPYEPNEDAKSLASYNSKKLKHNDESPLKINTIHTDEDK